MSEDKSVVPGLRVVAKANGFRRAGRVWSTEATDVPQGEFTAEQIAALRADPGLAVSEVELATDGAVSVATSVKSAATPKKK